MRELKPNECRLISFRGVPYPGAELRCVPPRHYPGTLTPIPAVERLRMIGNIGRNEVLALADADGMGGDR